MKKLLTFFLALAATTALWASNTITYTATEKLSGYYGSLNVGKTTFGSVITSHTFADDTGSITCSGEITTIGDWAFNGCSGLTSVTIPNSVTTIGYEAFIGCSGLTSVTIPNSVTTIGDKAFDGCSGLTSVTINSKSIVEKSYSYNNNIRKIFGSQVKEYIIGNSVTTIGNYAFYSCSGLTSVTIGNSVTTIGNSAFYNCSGLTSITIPNSVTMIGDEAFYHCTGLTSITIGNSVTKIGNSAFLWCSGLTSVTIGNSVTKIGDYAFSACSGLTKTNYTGTIADWCKIEFENDSSNPIYYSHNFFINDVEVKDLVIPNSVTTIGNYAFRGCSGLTSITIPNSVKTIGEDAFAHCGGLTSITIPNSVTTIGVGAFLSCSGLTSPIYNTTIFAYMPESYSGAYTIPNGIEQIAGGAFEYCSGLTSVTIPNSVTTIGDYAFSGCNLSSITIPNSVKTIGDYAFYNCERISTVTFGSGLWEIGDYAFSGDYRIADITCYAEVTPTIYAYTFEGITKKNVYLYVPENVIRRYQIDPYWNEFDIRTKSADVKPITGDQATVLPSANDAILTWPISNGAYTYTITITKGGETICLLTFNAQGQLQNIAFAAPGHDGAHQAPAATLTEQGYQFTVTGLNPGTAYGYSVTATDASRQTLAEYKGNFSTTGGTGFESVHGSQCTMHKYFHNGNLIIERNGAKYTATGQKVR